MGKYRVGTGALALIVIACITVGIIGGITYINGGLDWLIPGSTWSLPSDDHTTDVDAELAKPEFYLYREGQVSTKVTSADVFIWQDWNGDGVMQRGAFQGIIDGELVGGEIIATSSDSSSGLVQLTTNLMVGEPFYIFVDASGYQNTYAERVMTGEPDSNGRIGVADVAVRYTDDSITIDGLIKNKAWDDSSDYNYTLNGASGQATIIINLATSDAGISSQTSLGADMGAAFDDGEKWVHWDTGKEYAATFIGGYCSNQDATDLGLDSGDWDFWYEGASNTYFAKFITPFDDDEDLFYDSSEDSADTFSFTFSVDITAAGALTYVGVWQDVEWSDFARGNWATSGSTVLGTLGADWDWVA